MPVPDSMIVTATVAEASKEQRGDNLIWALRLEVKEISQYPLPMSMDASKATDIIKGSSHRVELLRGRLKPEKDGERAYDYWWELAAWDTDAPVSVAPVATSGGGSSDRSDLDRRIAWNSAVNNAVALFAAQLETSSRDYLVPEPDIIDGWAQILYRVIIEGPPGSAPEPEPPQDAPESHGEPPQPAVAPLAALKALNAIRERAGISVGKMAAWAKDTWGVTVRELDEGQVDLLIAALWNGDIAPDLKPPAPDAGTTEE